MPFFQKLEFLGSYILRMNLLSIEYVKDKNLCSKHDLFNGDHSLIVRVAFILSSSSCKFLSINFNDIDHLYVLFLGRIG